jgi:hypothetical protein
VEHKAEDSTGLKIYKDKVMYGVAFLGGPLAAGYIIAQNFKAFGKMSNYRTTWFITILATLGIFSSIILLPNSIKIPSYTIPLIYTAVAFGLMRFYQGKQIDDHISKGGQTHNVWRAALVGLLGLAITLAVFAPVAIALMPKGNYVVYYQPFRAMTHEISYNAEHIDDDEIKYLGEQLTQINYFDSTYVMYLYVDKENDALKISIPFVDPAWDDPEAIKYFQNIHTQLKESYSRKNFIEVLMCDTVLNVHRRLK